MGGGSSQFWGPKAPKVGFSAPKAGVLRKIGIFFEKMLEKPQKFPKTVPSVWFNFAYHPYIPLFSIFWLSTSYFYIFCEGGGPPTFRVRVGGYCHFWAGTQNGTQFASPRLILPKIAFSIEISIFWCKIDLKQGLNTKFSLLFMLCFPFHQFKSNKWFFINIKRLIWVFDYFPRSFSTIFRKLITFRKRIISQEFMLAFSVNWFIVLSGNRLPVLSGNWLLSWMWSLSGNWKPSENWSDSGH